jgi:hypothetical protein
MLAFPVTIFDRLEFFIKVKKDFLSVKQLKLTKLKRFIGSTLIKLDQRGREFWINPGLTIKPPYRFHKGDEQYEASKPILGKSS